MDSITEYLPVWIAIFAIVLILLFLGVSWFKITRRITKIQDICSKRFAEFYFFVNQSTDFSFSNVQTKGSLRIVYDSPMGLSEKYLKYNGSKNMAKALDELISHFDSTKKIKKKPLSGQRLHKLESILTTIYCILLVLGLLLFLPIREGLYLSYKDYTSWATIVALLYSILGGVFAYFSQLDQDIKERLKLSLLITFALALVLLALFCGIQLVHDHVIIR